MPVNEGSCQVCHDPKLSRLFEHVIETVKEEVQHDVDEAYRRYEIGEAASTVVDGDELMRRILGLYTHRILAMMTWKEGYLAALFDRHLREVAQSDDLPLEVIEREDQEATLALIGG